MKIFSTNFALLATMISIQALAGNSTDNNASSKYLSSEVITVIATKNPQNVFELPLMTSKVDTAKPQYANITNLSDVFANTAGIEIQGGPVRNAQQFSMRGYNAQGIVFLLDGTRQNFTAGHSSNIFLDPSLLKQVDVVKGSSSAIYGSGGLGGVISFETKDAKDMLKQGQKFGFMQKFGYFSGNNEKSSISSVYGSTDKVDAIANIIIRDSGTLKLGDGTKYNLADSEVKSGILKVNYALTDAQKLKFNFQSYKNNSNEFSNPEISAGSGNTFTDKKTQGTTTKVAYEYNPDSKLVDFSTQVYHVETDVEYTALDNKVIPVGGQRAQKMKTTGLDVQNVSIFDTNEKLIHRLTYGLNYFQDTQSSNNNGITWNLTPAGKTDIGGIFIQNEIKAKTDIGDFSVIPSLRYDDYRSAANGYKDTSDNAFSPRLAVGYMPTKWFNVFSNIGKGFRAPNASERYTVGQHFAIPMGSVTYLNQYVATPNLKAEKNTTYEVGFGLKFNDIITSKDQFHFKTSYFKTKATDYINGVVGTTVLNNLGSCFGPFGVPCVDNSYFQNVDSATIDGVDLMAEYATQKFTTSIGYNYTNGKDNNTGLYLGNLLPQTIKTNLAYKFTKEASAGFRSTFAERMDKVNAGTSEVAGYGVHDVYTQYNYNDSVAVSFAVNNIFDKAYRKPYTTLYQVGRDYRITVSYKY